MNDSDTILCPDCKKVIEMPEEEETELICSCGTVLISEEQEYRELLLAEEISRKWYYSRGKQRYGPVPWNRLKKLISDEKLNPDDLIWTREMECWEKIRNVPELTECFPEGRRPEAIPGKKLVSPLTTLTETGPKAPPPKNPGEADSPKRAAQGTFMIQVSAGLLAALSFFQIIGTGVVAYAYLENYLTASVATWLGAALIVGSILCAGASKSLRLLCLHAHNT